MEKNKMNLTRAAGTWFQMKRGAGTARFVSVCLRLVLCGKWIARMVRNSLGSAAAMLRLDSRGAKGIIIQER